MQCSTEQESRVNTAYFFHGEIANRIVFHGEIRNGIAVELGSSH
jgi:hypothetical protein